MKYKILSFGELTKKTEGLIEALKDLDSLEKMKGNL
jgi:hypothetical protein